jgi:hypothetical protein
MVKCYESEILRLRLRMTFRDSSCSAAALATALERIDLERFERWERELSMGRGAESKQSAASITIWLRRKKIYTATNANSRVPRRRAPLASIATVSPARIESRMKPFLQAGFRIKT